MGCVPYSKVLRYEHCAAVYQGTEIHGVSESSSAKPTHFMNHVADRNTFYGMCIICSVTSDVSSSFAIPRLKDVSTEDLTRLTEIEQNILPSRPLRLKFIKLNESVNSFYSPISAWATT